LSTGAVVQLGDYRLELRDEQVAAPPPEDTTRVRPDRLVMVIGPTPGMEYPLAGERINIGRAEDAKVSINHASVSRLHVELVAIAPSRWEVIDQGSANGVRINGVELRRGIIEPGDALELGDVRLRYVAAGKFFRPSVDISQQLPAVVPFEGMSPTAATAAVGGGQRGAGTIVAALVVAAALGIGGYVVLRKGGGGDSGAGSTSAPMATSEAEAQALLKQAEDFAGDDIETAHKLLQRIPESSPARDSKEYRALEDRWADFMLDKADRTTDVTQKRRILNLISETSGVSGEKRNKAAQLALALGPPIDLDRDHPTARPYGPAPTGGPVSTGAAAPSASPPAGSTGTPIGPKPTASSTPTSTKSDKFDQSAQKASLMAKMQSGTATERDLNMLKAICMSDGDRACRNQAVAKLNALKKQDGN
jgi:hypothetical protein